MIEQPPASMKKINNLFADAQSTESVSLPNASGTFSGKFGPTAASKMKVLNLALISSAATAKEQTLETCS